MLSGIGTMIGAGAVVAAAWIGRSTFNDWKEERVEERRMHIAERTFVLAHRCQIALGIIRFGFVIEEERVEIADRLRLAIPGFAELSDYEQYPKIFGQAVLDRIQDYQEEWGEIGTLRPLLLAYFDENAAQHLAVFLTLKSTIEMLAKELLGLDPDDGQRANSLRAKISEDGAVSVAIETAITELHNVMIPKLRTKS